jgi:site-specific DNA-methyltransferase (adenine-specific)
MKGQETLFSHKSDDWETPDNLFKQLDEEFHFECDAAADDTNTRCEYYLDPELLPPLELESWGDLYKTFYLNPPYSQVEAFVKKASCEADKGAIIVCLLPARTDTKWWHEYVLKASEIRFIKGRIKFRGAENSAPFPSVIVIFRKDIPYLYTQVSSMVVKK